MSARRSRWRPPWGIGATAAVSPGIDLTLASKAFNLAGLKAALIVTALLGDVLSRELPQISWTPPQATFLAWLDYGPREPATRG